MILAIGQAPDLSWLEQDDGVEITPRGLIGIDSDTLATSAPGIYAGGDVAFGPRNLIDAIGDGRRAAASIHAQIAGLEAPRPTLKGRTLLPIIEVKRPSVDYTAIARVAVPAEPTERRVGSPEIELGYTEEEARTEASRCLQCFLNITLDPSLCILCGGCVDICPENCIRIVPVDDIDGIASDVRRARSCSRRTVASAARSASIAAPPTRCRWRVGRRPPRLRSRWNRSRAEEADMERRTEAQGSGLVPRDLPSGAVFRDSEVYRSGDPPPAVPRRADAR